MTCFSRELHPVYGAVPRDGEHVEAGEILGLSPDAKDVVTAPLSGWVRLVASPGASDRRLTIEVWQNRRERDEAQAAEYIGGPYSNAG
jgi:hypothetical protein